MTARRHARDAHTEATRLTIATRILMDMTRAGQAVGESEVNTILQLVRITAYHVSRTLVALDHLEAPERRQRVTVTEPVREPVPVPRLEPTSQEAWDVEREGL